MFRERGSRDSTRALGFFFQLRQAFTDDYLIAKMPEDQISDEILVINKVISFPFSVQSDSGAQVAASVEGLRHPIGSGDHGGNCEFLL